MTDYIEDNMNFTNDILEDCEELYNEEENNEKDSYIFYDNAETPVYSYSDATKKKINNELSNGYKKFNEDDYKELNENLLRYKSGNTEAAQYIISAFHYFIKKYVDFIFYGEYENRKYRKQYDKSLTQFISLFISKKDRESINTVLEKNLLFSKTCVKIQKLFSHFDYWDIYNELTCALLNMANKYKVLDENDKYYKKNGTFHMYVNKCFHFDAYNTLTKIIGDPLAHINSYSIDSYYKVSTDSNEYDAEFHNIFKDDNSEIAFDRMIAKISRTNDLENCDKTLRLKENTEIDPYEIDSLNFNWTNGNTCSKVFKCLTSYERELIVMSFVKNKTDSEIANIYGCHRITIVKHKKNAIEKIKKYMENNKEE